MLSIANEPKRGSLSDETDPFVGLHSNFLENQNVGMSRSKMFQSTPGTRSSANVQGCDAKRTRIRRFANAASFGWVKSEQRVNL